MTSMHDGSVPVDHWRLAGELGIRAGKIDAILASIKRMAEDYALINEEEGSLLWVNAECIEFYLDEMLDLLYPKHTASTSSTVAQEGRVEVEVA